MKHPIALSLLVTGLVFSAQAVEISIGIGGQPPSPRTEVIYAAPSQEYVWMPGHWIRTERSWVWYPGYWEYPPRANVEWTSGRWAQTHGTWAWSEGSWTDRNSRSGHRGHGSH